uniref:Microtubule-associated protein Jupiter n=1 Tax=Corethrella appendiculata TaxID=1370023 RepID=U5ERZ6_9DIPT
MTSTNIQIGFGENSKSSSKVLKPPGGGSSDLFGPEPQVQRTSSKNRMQSNIFADEPTPAKNGESRRNNTVDSHNRLFGEAGRPYTPAKNHMKSNLPIGGDETDKANGKTANGNGHHYTNGKSETNGYTNGHTNGSSENGSVTKNGGNPVTGEGYKNGGAAEINTTVPSLNTGHVINKNRIPPGGFSSGLW